MTVPGRTPTAITCSCRLCVFFGGQQLARIEPFWLDALKSDQNRFAENKPKLLRVMRLPSCRETSTDGMKRYWKLCNGQPLHTMQVIDA